MTETLAEKKCTPCRGGVPPLTPAERIVAALKAGETIRGVADKFDVNPSTVQRIKHPFVVAA